MATQTQTNPWGNTTDPAQAALNALKAYNSTAPTIPPGPIDASVLGGNTNSPIPPGMPSPNLPSNYVPTPPALDQTQNTPIDFSYGANSSNSLLSQRLAEAQQKLLGVGAAKQQGYTAAGLPDLNKQLADLKGQYDVQAALFNSAKENFRQGQVGTQELSTGKIAQIERQQGAKLGIISAQILATQGSIEAATKEVDRAIENEFGQYKQQIDNLIQFKAFNNDDLSESQKIKLSAEIARQKTDYDAKVELATYRAKKEIDAKAEAAGYNIFPTAPSYLTVGSPTSLVEFAQQAGVDFKTLADLNPQLKTGTDKQGNFSVRPLKAGEKINMPTKTVSIAQNPDGTYDTTAQENILSRMDPSRAALIRSIGNYQLDLSKVVSLTGGQREALAAQVAAVYPGFDMSKYATNLAYKKSLTSGQMYQGIIAANKSINHLTSFADSVSKLGNIYPSYKLNSTSQHARIPFSGKLQTNLKAAQTEASGLKDELAKFFKGTGATDVTSIAEWGKNLDTGANAAGLKGTVQGAITLLAGQLDVLEQQYKQTLGTDPGNTFLQQATIDKLSKLKNQGYIVDIPGVYYTNKSSWLKYGNGTQDSWNSAIDMLTQAGIPLTTENILQAAQL